MKSLLSLLLFVLCFTSKATTYYISASGSDANNGTSAATPWKSLSKLNSYFSSLMPGDNVLLHRGDVFPGTITINKSGTAASRITIDAYGAGAQPVVTGFSTVSAWTNLGGNIWESTSAVSTLSTCNMVVINGVNTPVGRFPNTGYLAYQSATTTSLTSSSLPSGTTNWTGAVAVKRSNNWIIDKVLITSHSGNVINYSSVSGYGGVAGYGFFIQNDARTLDVQNEWYYNPSTKKIRIFSTSSPTGVQVSTVDNLVVVSSRNYITYKNVSFTGSNSLAFSITSSIAQTISNCTIDFSGIDALRTGGSSCDSIKILNSLINHTNNNAIWLGAGGTNATVSFDTVKNTVIYPGMMSSADDNGFAIRTNNGTTGGVVIQNCIIDSCGYIGIYPKGNNNIVRNNLVNNHGMVKMDGAGIYSYYGKTPSIWTGTKIYNNIVLNGIGNIAGTTYSVPLVLGIYLDGCVANIELYGNTCANNSNSGFLINSGSSNINAHDNTFYNNGTQIQVTSTLASPKTANVTLLNNIAVSRTSGQNLNKWETSVNSTGEISTWGTPAGVDNNYLARPIDDNLTIGVTINGFLNNTVKTLAQWVTYSGFDVHSKKSPKTITTVNDLRFEYNATGINRTVTLGGKYIDMKNTSYNGSITLAPYSSVVLILNGTASNQPPAANAGANQSITLPTNNASLTGSGTDADGTVAAYAWTKISGPASGTITNANSASTTITGMAQGIYQYQLKVTDNSAATASDTMQITIIAATNTAPAAHAGADQSITLPTNTASLTGSATDADGTVAAYAWTKISGPAAGTITDASSASTTITGMTQGVYQYQLKATDNGAATAFDTIQITINATANVAPTVNAGADQAMTLPTNTASLAGNGSDADGTISSYAWTKISGPASGTITNASSASTTITGMTQGVYQYQLKATDNSAATTSDTIQITVTAAGNVAPTVNAGADQAMTLPTNTASLAGNGTDPDGTISSYAWTKISGPASGTITNASSASTTITGMTQGVYQYQLKATDNSAATAFDTIQVTVNAAGGLLPAVYPTNTVRGLDYKYYEGSSYSVVPNFSTLTPVKTGTSRNFTISLANRPTAYAFNFTGFITVPSDGQYTFYTTSDDGSNLYIDNVLVVNNDGLHSSAEKSGTIGLKAGKHAISVGYFQQSGGNVLNVNYSGPGLSKRAVPASALYRISTQGFGYGMSMDAPGANQITSSQVTVKAYPNPFVNNIEINITGGVAGDYKLVLIDASGRIIWMINGIKDAGSFHQSVNTSNLVKGMYFLKVIQDNNTSVIKLVK